jgi:hypothetical protein
VSTMITNDTVSYLDKVMCLNCMNNLFVIVT